MATNFDLEILIKARNQLQKGVDDAKKSIVSGGEQATKATQKIETISQGKSRQQFIRETQARLKIASKLLDAQDKANNSKKGGLLSRLFGGGGSGGSIRDSMMLTSSGARPRVILAGILGLAAGVAFFIGKMVLAEQQIKVTFDLLYSDANRGAQALTALDQVAGNATFGHAAIDSAGASMLNYGYSLQTTLTTVQALSDANAALGNSGDQVAAQAKALAQMNETGFVTGGQVSALEAGGIPALKLLSGGDQRKALGLQKVISRGGMRSDAFLTQLNTAMENQYGGASETRVSTPQGRLSAFADQISRGDLSGIAANTSNRGFFGMLTPGSSSTTKGTVQNTATTKGVMQNASGANVSDTYKKTTAVWRVINLFTSKIIMRFKQVYLNLRSDWQTIYKDIIKWWNQNIIAWLNTNVMPLPLSIIAWFAGIPTTLNADWVQIQSDINTSLGPIQLWFDTNIKPIPDNIILWFKGIPKTLSDDWIQIQTDINTVLGPISLWFDTNIKPIPGNIILWFKGIPKTLNDDWLQIQADINTVLGPVSLWFDTNIKPIPDNIILWFKGIPGDLLGDWDQIKNDERTTWVVISTWFDTNVKPIPDNIIGWFKGIPKSVNDQWIQIQTDLDTTLKPISLWFDTNIKPISGNIVLWFKGIPKSINDQWVQIQTDLDTTLKPISTWFDTNIKPIPDNIIAWFKGIPKTLNDQWVQIQTDINTVLGPISTWFDTNIKPIPDNIILWFKGVPKSINNQWIQIQNDINTVLGPVSLWFDTNIKPIPDNIILWFKGIPKTLSDDWAQVQSDINTILGPVSAWFDTNIKPIAGNIILWFKGIPDSLTKTWDTINTNAYTGWANIYNTIVNAIDSIILYLKANPIIAGLIGLGGVTLNTIPFMPLTPGGSSNNPGMGNQTINVNMAGSTIYGFNDFQSQVVSAINTAQRAGRI